jgi:peptidoglycan/xylan/chitin deacetylase (PgdA/CDA1 family)
MESRSGWLQMWRVSRMTSAGLSLNRWMPRDSGARMMTPEELRDLISAGFEIGSRTFTHPDLSMLDYEGCLREMLDSRSMLRRHSHVRVSLLLLRAGSSRGSKGRLLRASRRRTRLRRREQREGLR